MSQINLEQRVNGKDIATLTGVYSLKQGDLSELCHAIHQYTNFCESTSSDFLVILEQYFSSYSMISTLYVDADKRGNGFASKLVDEYIEKTKDFDISFVYARTATPQLNDFNLQYFYESKGFEKIMYNNGDTLMVSTKCAKKIKTLLGI